MGGAKQGASESFVNSASRRSRDAFAAGKPWLQKGIGMAMQGVDLGGEPGYLGRALDVQQGLASDALAGNAQAEEIAQLIASKGVAAGGNATGAMNPQAYGAKMAQFVASSGVNRANNRVGQMLDAAGVAMGGAGGAADASLRAYSNQLQAISMMPGYNEKYASILAGVNAAGAIGGGLYQAGVFNRQQPINFGNYAAANMGPGVGSPAAGTNGWGTPYGSGLQGPPPSQFSLGNPYGYSPGLFGPGRTFGGF